MIQNFEIEWLETIKEHFFIFSFPLGFRYLEQ